MFEIGYEKNAKTKCNDRSKICSRNVKVRLHTEVIWIREIDERIRLGYG